MASSTTCRRKQPEQTIEILPNMSDGEKMDHVLESIGVSPAPPPQLDWPPLTISDELRALGSISESPDSVTTRRPRDVDVSETGFVCTCPAKQLTVSSTIHEPSKIEKADGVAASPLYQKLPAEVRRSIYLYLVTFDRSINASSYRRGSTSGFRFCVCDRNPSANSLECPDRCLRFGNNVFLVSRTVRRDCLDMFLMCNRFAYTNFTALSTFTLWFHKSSSCVQNIHLQIRLCNMQGSWESESAASAASARQRLSNLKTVSVHATILPFSALERLDESELVMPPTCFALGEAMQDGSMCEMPDSPNLTKKFSPVTPLVGFSCVVDFTASYEITDYISKMCHRIETYLRDVFTQAGRSYQRLSQVPRLISVNPRTERDPSSSRKGEERQGILIMGD